MEKQNRNTKKKTMKAVPEGMHTVTPFLIVDGASDLLRFIEQSFGGKVTAMLKTEDGKIMHSDVMIGDSHVMVTDATEKYTAYATKLYLYVDDVDATYKKALDANATSIRELTDEFYGDRSGGVRDAWGNEWWIATHIEDVDNAEIERRAKEFMQETHA
ncbi:MAG TPA: VOC family protein [Ohtaekwangia sp.]